MGTEIIEVCDELQDWFEKEWIEAGLAGPDQAAAMAASEAARAAQRKRRAEEQAESEAAAEVDPSEEPLEEESELPGAGNSFFSHCFLLLLLPVHCAF